MELQRWRCPDCLSVFDVYVEDAGRAAEMKDECCPTCWPKPVLGHRDDEETALWTPGDTADEEC